MVWWVGIVIGWWGGAMGGGFVAWSDGVMAGWYCGRIVLWREHCDRLPLGQTVVVWRYGHSTMYTLALYHVHAVGKLSTCSPA